MSETPKRTEARDAAMSVLSEAIVFIELVEHRAELFTQLARDLPELLPDAIRLVASVENARDELTRLQQRVEKHG